MRVLRGTKALFTGASGLVAAKALKGRGVPFDCFEMGADIGGLWRYNNDSGKSAAYASLPINTSRDRMQFSDFPMPRHYPDFPHHSLILEYFESYLAELKQARRLNRREVNPATLSRVQVESIRRAA